MKQLTKRIKKQAKRASKLKRQRAKLNRRLAKTERRMERSKKELTDHKRKMSVKKESIPKSKRNNHTKDPYTVWARSEQQAEEASQSITILNDGARKVGEKKYAKELAFLKEMGFKDAALNRRLMEENKGDVKATVWLLSLANKE